MGVFSSGAKVMMMMMMVSTSMAMAAGTTLCSLVSPSPASLPALQAAYPWRPRVAFLPQSLSTTNFGRAKRFVGVWNTAFTVASSEEHSTNGQGFGPDMFVLDLAEKLEESEYAQNCGVAARQALSTLRERSAEVALSSQWPTNKSEAYRFTDLKFLKKSQVNPASLPPPDLSLQLSGLNLTKDESLRLVFVDGFLSSSLSNSEKLPEGVSFGSISTLSDDLIRNAVSPKLGESAEWIDGDFFASLNGVGARELGVIIIPEGFALQVPIHIVYYSSQGGNKDSETQTYLISCPRLLVVVSKGAKVNIVEEFIGEAQKMYWSNAVAEFFIEEGGEVRHSYIQNQEREAVHIKQTCVAQKEHSRYQLVEAGLGSKLSRHNLHIQQLGPDTQTKVSTFLLAGQNQLQDLHSKLILSHPRGFGRQLQKSIVIHSSGHSVFDGNIKVNRYAQQTDAGQLSRSLLLSPRGTVNIKPNLQIIADDVKCSHGAAISDLQEEQLFYFRARGIDPQTARNTLIFSFGAEVLEQLEYQNLQKRVESIMIAFLRAEGAISQAGSNIC